MPRLIRSAALLAAAVACSAQAADWRDTAVSYRYGSRYAEPFNGRDIDKHIFNLSHGAGYQYGKHVLSVDWLLSSRDDPASATGGRAREVYALYRHTLDLGKLSGANLAIGPLRGVGATAGFDVNRKNDAGYNSRKRMLVAGPTLMLDVPGFLDISLLAIWESNAPSSDYSGQSTPRYRYRTHPMLSAAWSIPFHAGVPLEFSGYVNVIGAKGRNEFGGGTAPETNVDAQIMYDLGAALGRRKNTVKVGVEYQYWRNKFGNPAKNTPGATARTPMLRAEFHF